MTGVVGCMLVILRFLVVSLGLFYGASMKIILTLMSFLLSSTLLLVATRWHRDMRCSRWGPRRGRAHALHHSNYTQARGHVGHRRHDTRRGTHWVLLFGRWEEFAAAWLDPYAPESEVLHVFCRHPHALRLSNHVARSRRRGRRAVQSSEARSGRLPPDRTRGLAAYSEVRTTRFPPSSSARPPNLQEPPRGHVGRLSVCRRGLEMMRSYNKEEGKFNEMDVHVIKQA